MFAFFSLFYTFDGKCQTYSKPQACARKNKIIENVSRFRNGRVYPQSGATKPARGEQYARYVNYK
jgi:hypothetical protein